MGPLIVEYNTPHVVNSSLVHIFDQDSAVEDLLLILVESPTNGYLYKVLNGKDVVLHQGSNFTAKDIDEGRIIYKHSRGSSFHGQMFFELHDGRFTTNPAKISINVISALRPRVVKNDVLIVRKGDSAVITKNILHIIDQDSPESVNVIVRDGPHKGRLTIHNEDLALFSLLELSKNIVTYVHDNQDAQISNSSFESDEVLLQANDGHNVVNFRFQIILVDHDKPTPVLVKNERLRIQRGSRKQITPNILQARDVDDRADQLVYSMDDGHFSSKGN